MSLGQAGRTGIRRSGKRVFGLMRQLAIQGARTGADDGVTVRSPQPAPAADLLIAPSDANKGFKGVGEASPSPSRRRSQSRSMTPA